jgi:hypothetical protein
MLNRREIDARGTMKEIVESYPTVNTQKKVVQKEINAIIDNLQKTYEENQRMIQQKNMSNY